MKLGKFKILIFFILVFAKTTVAAFSEDIIQEVPLINLEELSPTFEEGKDELEKIDEASDNLKNDNEDLNTKSKIKEKKLATKLFAYSIFYLFMIFTSILIDKFI